MDVQTCIAKLGYVGVLNFATVDSDGAPQVRSISAVHYEGTDIYLRKGGTHDVWQENF